ncbi:MAG TPA: hypothetical protein PK109_00370 [Candidatus Paceibacterota bacterium]|nr:hypothetical protein [Candidatus Paceibacterota bacterium]
MPKTITDIIPPSRRRAMEEAGQSQAYAPASYQPPADMPPMPPAPPRDTTPMGSMGRPRSSFPWRLATAAVVVVVIAIGAIYAFSGAKVTVTPTMNVATVGGEFTATPSAGELPFEVITVEKVGTQPVKAEGTENANDPSQGMITIYNGQEKVQELIKNTRFATPDGLIFRIHDSVKIPAGSPTAPGQLQVTVYADAGGEKYNIGPSTFTLPGLKGSAVYDLVYAKSTGSMSGGFSGVRPSVSGATRDAQASTIEAGLDKDLREEIGEKIPEGYILVPGAVFISYAQLPDAAGENNNVNVQEKGTANAFVFPKAALAKAIAYQSVGTYAGQPVTIESAERLTFAPKNGEAPVPGADSATFTLSGTVDITWVVDPAKISGSVAGKSRQAAQTILAGFPEVEKAVLSLKPFWAGEFPEDPAEIKVLVETEDAD